VIDAGANIGFFTLHTSRAVSSSGSVHAFEPNPAILSRLTANVRANGLDNVVLNGTALGSRDTMVELIQPLPNRSGDASLYFQESDPALRVQIRQQTLDQYCHYRGIVPDLVKVDVEGAELEVLRGARHLLGTARPMLVVEHNPVTSRRSGFETTDMARWLENEFGYRVLWIGPRQLTDYWLAIETSDILHATGNLLVLPGDSAPTVVARINGSYPVSPMSYAALEFWPPERGRRGN
jgi:FkbM family methyltransferase